MAPGRKAQHTKFEEGGRRVPAVFGERGMASQGAKGDRRRDGAIRQGGARESIGKN